MSSRYWRTMAFNVTVGIAIEYAISFAIALYFYETNQYFYALLILLVFWAIQIGLWFKSQIVATLFYYLTGKKQLTTQIESQLRLHKMPFYDEFSAPDATEYLTRVMDDKNSNREQIKLAASTLGCIQMLRESRPTAMWRTMFIIEAALEDYRRQGSNEQHRYTENTTNEKRPRNHTTSAMEPLSEEDEKRQTELIGLIQAKSRWASLLAWSASSTADEDDWKKYLGARNDAFDLFDQVTDEFYRDTSAHFLVEMLTIAQETDRAQALVDSMTVDFIKERAAADVKTGAKDLYERLHMSRSSG